MQHRQFYVYQKFANKYRRGGKVVVSREFEDPHYFEGNKRFENAGGFLYNVLGSAKQFFPICSVPAYDKGSNLKALTKKEEERVLGTIAMMRRRTDLTDKL